MARRLSPPRLLAASFGGVIALGTLLLSLPIAAAPDRHIPVVDALFTATSAVCVTGLIVRDTPVDFSPFGHVVILLLIQAGGLGYMTISTVVAAALGKRVTLQERLTLQEGLNVHTLEGLLGFVVAVARLTLAFELAGAVTLGVRWAWDFGAGRGAWLGLFHAVSAFNNAGFSLFSSNLMSYRDDVTVNLVITSLIITGGIGFFVLTEIGGLRRRHRASLSLHSRLVLATTAILIAGGTVTLLLLERDNPRTLGSLGPLGATLAAYFQAVTPRTAGFNTIDIGAMTPPALFVVMVMMFIGASPGSTGGGVKTSTFAVTVLALWATVRGIHEPSVFRRRIPADIVARSFFVCLIAFLTMNIVAGLVLVAERLELLPILFETTSAFGTVGLSMGRPGSAVSLVGHFSPAGKMLVAAMMFMGRVGPLTLAIAVVGGAVQPRIRYPEGKVLIG